MTKLPQIIRSCQAIGCNMCCDLPAIKALKKPCNELCGHHDGDRCTIYSGRPDECRNFQCAWLADKTMDFDYAPTNIGCYAIIGELIVEGRQFAAVNVHEASPGSYKNLLPWLEQAWCILPQRGIDPVITIYTPKFWKSLILVPGDDGWTPHFVCKGKLNRNKPVHKIPLVTPEACSMAFWNVATIKREIKRNKKRSK